MNQITMPLDDNVFANGAKVPVDNPVENDGVYANGELISDRDESNAIFIDGRGLGGKFAGIFPSAIVENCESGEPDRTTAINGDNIGDDRVELEEGLDEGTQDVAKIDYEDSDLNEGTNDFGDCRIIIDQSMLDSDGYAEVEIRHLNANFQHEWWLGPTKSDGYFVGCHSDSEFTTNFEGRYYENGDVTDLNGNKLGTWK